MSNNIFLLLFTFILVSTPYPAFSQREGGVRFALVFMQPRKVYSPIQSFSNVFLRALLGNTKYTSHLNILTLKPAVWQVIKKINI